MTDEPRDASADAEVPEPSPASAPSPSGRRVWPALLVAALFVVAFRIGLGVDRRPAPPTPTHGAPAADEDSGALDPALAGLGRSLAALRVRNVAGEVVAAAPAGRASVVMVSSVTCGYCERSLRDLAAMAGGRPLPGLRVVTLEGAEPGARMLERMGVRGAVSTGPVGSSEQVLLTFRIPGTPIFASVNPAGRLTGVVPGYPGPEGLAPLYRVMVGRP